MISDAFLAMTAAELQMVHPVPAPIAWMACHFSPYATGLSNLPARLPEGSLLILSDRIPIQGHDPSEIAAQLEESVRIHRCRGILLDFQRRPNEETQRLTDHLLRQLSCPMAVSEPFAREHCPVILPPCPPHIPIQDYLLPWKDRETWLELSLSPMTISLTADGAEYGEADAIPEGKNFPEENLHCHYQIQCQDDLIRFHLWRGGEDLSPFMEAAKALGVRQFVGLYQELHTIIY